MSFSLPSQRHSWPVAATSASPASSTLPPVGPIGITTLSLAPTTVNATTGSAVQFTARGGILPYTWAADAGSPPANGLYTVPGTPGTYTVTVTDAAGITQEATVIATAVIPLSLSPAGTPAAPLTVNIGSTISFTAAGASESYTWDVPSLGSLAPSGSTAVYTATSAGTTTVTVRDQFNPSDFREATISIVTPVTLTISPKAPAILIGGSVSFSAGGGSGSYSFRLVSGAGSFVTSTYTAPDFSEEAVIEVTDDVTGHTDTATVTVYFPLTIIPTTVTLQPDTAYQFSASGGVPPYTFTVLPPGTGTMGGVDGDIFTAPPAVEPNNIVQVEDSLLNSSTAAVTIQSPPAGWIITSIDTAARSGQYASLALIPGTDRARIAYQESAFKLLRMASWNPPAPDWTVEAAGPPPTAKAPQYISLALDPTGGNYHPRIAYYDGVPNRNLMLASWNGTSWLVETVDSTGDVGQYASLAVDTSGYPRVAYYDATNGNLKYAAWDGTTWLVETVDPTGDVGQYASLALDSLGRPHIAYHDADAGDLKYAGWNGTSWDIETADPSLNIVGQYASLALDSLDRPRIAYYDATRTSLKYVERNGAWGPWTRSTMQRMSASTPPSRWTALINRASPVTMPRTTI